LIVLRLGCTDNEVMKYFLLTLLFFSCLPVYAQELEPKKSKRTCRLVFPERPNNAPKIVCLFDGKENQKVFLPSMNFSKVISLPKGDITIMMAKNEITDLENLPKGAPILKIPETVKDFYILVTPDPSNKNLPVKMNLVNAGDGKLVPGKTLWFNLTKHRIVANLGKSKMMVDPKGWSITDGPLPQSGYYRAEFGYQVEAKGKARRITEQQWWHDVNSRHLGFIVSSGGRLPKIFFFRDFR
jgi:hypothetical protein